MKHISYDSSSDQFIVTMVIPKHMTGTYTYDETEEWKMPAVSVFIDRKFSEYSLNNTMYLDYKDSLQSTSPILYFDDEHEAVSFAEKHGLMVEYSHSS
jgi:hypothetical protein